MLRVPLARCPHQSRRFIPSPFGPTHEDRLELYASLAQYLPADARKDNRLPLELPGGSSIAQVIDPFRLPEKLVHLVLVNGVYVPPERRMTHVLSDGDLLAIWPPIAGG